MRFSRTYRGPYLSPGFPSPKTESKRRVRTIAAITSNKRSGAGALG
jgi:hypothetical protein